MVVVASVSTHGVLGLVDRAWVINSCWAARLTLAPSPAGAGASTGAFRAGVALVGAPSVLGLIKSAVGILGQLEHSWAVGAALAPVVGGASAVTGALTVVRASIGTHGVLGLIDLAGGGNGR